MLSFREIVDESLPLVRVVDVGAAEFQRDPYASLSEQGLCEVIGFEPHPENCAQRNANARSGHRYLPYALGDGGVHRFYECTNPLASSFYQPNAPLLSRFSLLGQTIVSERDVQTYRLDDVAEIEDIDYLKMDVQGSELDVINGAPRLLKSTALVHTEVGFIPMYVDQPLFGDIDLALRKSGLWLHKLDSIRGRVLLPLLPNNNPYAPLSQILWADSAVYARSFMSFDTMPPEKLLKLAIVLHEVYQSWDLAALALLHYDHLTGKSLWLNYVACISGELQGSPS